MMLHWGLFIVCALIGTTSVQSSLGECLRWYEGHQECHFCATSSMTSETRSLEGRTVCHDAPYVNYFKHMQSQPPTPYHKTVADAVMALYSDLEHLRKPAVLVNEAVPPDTFHVRGRKPAYYIASLEKNITQYPRLNIFPISFGTLDAEFVNQLPAKQKALGRVIPGNVSTYFSLDEESLYYADLRASLMALTYKKGGWDCLRHYEILASGTLPLFLDIAQCPLHAMRLHPRRLYALILQFPGLTMENLRRVDRMTYQFDRIDVAFNPATSTSTSAAAVAAGTFDTPLYVHLTSALLQYSRAVLSTKALAQYVVQTMHRYSEGKIASPVPKSILYLTHQDRDMDKGDYLTDFLLLGLYEWLGYQSGRVVDFPRRDCLYKSYEQFGSSQYRESRKRLYGYGFVFGHKIDVYVESARIDRQGPALRQRLRNHDFDLVILGSGHRDGWASTLHLWEAVCLHYDRREVAMVFGADYPLPKKILHRYAPCAAHIFSREGYENEADLVYDAADTYTMQYRRPMGRTV